jgi:FixJ family two-component response regulator
MVLVPSVYLVDADCDFVSSCRDLFVSRGFSFSAFSSPEQLIRQAPRISVGCIVTDLSGPGWSGVSLCPMLKQEGWTIPVIVAASHGDIPTCSNAFRAGVADFFLKPITPDDLWNCVSRNLDGYQNRQHYWVDRVKLAQKLACLTDREEAVARALVSGQSMKEIACNFGTSFQSVARHRQRILLKLKVENDVALANLVRDHFPPDTQSSAVFDSELAIVQD